MSLRIEWFHRIGLNFPLQNQDFIRLAVASRLLPYPKVPICLPCLNCWQTAERGHFPMTKNQMPNWVAIFSLPNEPSWRKRAINGNRKMEKTRDVARPEFCCRVFLAYVSWKIRMILTAVNFPYKWWDWFHNFLYDRKSRGSFHIIWYSLFATKSIKQSNKSYRS